MLRVVGHFENEILYHFNQNGSLLSNHNLGPERLTFNEELFESTVDTFLSLYQ